MFSSPTAQLNAVPNPDFPLFIPPLQDDLQRHFDAQLERIRQRLRSAVAHSLGPRKPDLEAQELALQEPHERSEE